MNKILSETVNHFHNASNGFWKRKIFMHFGNAIIHIDSIKAQKLFHSSTTEIKWKYLPQKPFAAFT